MKQVQQYWSIPIDTLLSSLGSSRRGLEEKAVQERKRVLKNWHEHENKRWILAIFAFVRQFRSPLILLLLVAVILSSILHEYGNAGIILMILFFTGLLSFVQERKANRAVEKLRLLVHIKSTVVRDGQAYDIPGEEVVQGDVVQVRAGDIIPGDAILIRATDLYVNQSALTGESFPSEKEVSTNVLADSTLIQRRNVLFYGSSVISGTGEALVIFTGNYTELGKIKRSIEKTTYETAFEKGIRKFGYSLLQLTLVLSLFILLLNLFLGKPVVASLLFSLAFAVGMAPELLPAIVTITLAAGASRMSQKKVIVKKLASIQNLGGMDVFCSDKTGTLTEGIVKVHSAINAKGEISDKVKLYAFLNAHFEAGYTNPVDQAICREFEMNVDSFSKCDEVPYDFIRKRLSIVVSDHDRKIMICKGAVKEVLEICDKTEDEVGHILPIGYKREALQASFEKLSKEGYRVLAISWKDVTEAPSVNKDDETAMVFLGFLVLNDPPKIGVADTIIMLKELGISFKLITGDNQWVAAHVAKEIGLAANVLNGATLSNLTDEMLMRKITEVDVFAEMSPYQKERIVRAFQKLGKTVGFMGDGINDASAIHVADVGISIENAVDVAKEAADIVLMENDLMVLREGVIEGRKTFVNTLKYIFITMSANFGNMISVALAALFLPFLPLLPVQILLINFLSDIPSLAIASDKVDFDQLEKPRRWNMNFIRKFMLVFGLESSVFDLITFAALYWLFHLSAEVFRTGWFVESIITEILILLIIRTQHPFLKSAPSKVLMLSCLTITAVALLMPYSPPAVRSIFQFIPLPLDVLLLLFSIIVMYALLSETTKKILFKRLKY